ncbi:transmembrane protein 59-like [Tribolium castaneum]|uniref:Transmembrane protein 59-like Protein n=1 Tax=Tribolium castaneum TaxID=7070 RepID=D6X2V9_TRICA|nr:PREDICTED: transmembrane protein 59-like [Tribolium castaneum]EFA10636.1 Transmembrane protein 59-like Protein [Tribolium castaneum]|eukprot:XP_967775.1 PREDICTED: transmembrane protein 59-like [Tribolium castaneum]
MWKFLLIFALKTATSDEIFTSTFSVTDQCISLCKENELPLLDLENYEQIVCQRGCRFFNIINFKDELNLNTTRKECHLSCNESYIVAKENEICLKGCDLMAKKRQSDMSTFLVITEDDESHNIVLAEPDLEILESDILSDPSIKSQLEIGFNIDYKIPETHIRTMPIEFKDDTIVIKSSEYSGDWLDCASRNSGIPRWILLTAFLSAVLVALWLSFSTEKKNTEEVAEVDIPDEKLILENEEKDPELLEDFQEIGFSTPPKYTVESEKV